jgi:hypothetical protein
MGRPHKLSPLVTDCVVEPVLNPICLFFSRRLIRYDFPVRYMPAMVITAMGLSKEESSCLACWVR